MRRATSATGNASSPSSITSSRASRPSPPPNAPCAGSWLAPPCSTSATTGRRGVDLPPIRKTYWPHADNFRRLQSSSLDWRLLCPGPMVEEPPVGLARLRVSRDRLPVEIPGADDAVAGPPPRPALHGARAGDDRAVRRCRGADAEPSAARERHVAPPHRSRVAHRDARHEGGVVCTSRNGGHRLNTLVRVEGARAGPLLPGAGAALARRARHLS